LDKAQIIQRGLELKVPFDLIWSCYEEAEVQCGQCPSCIRVAQAQQGVQGLVGQNAGITFKQAAQ
jgi:7-cyano-7-deazaguanine synthase